MILLNYLLNVYCVQLIPVSENKGETGIKYIAERARNHIHFLRVENGQRDVHYTFSMTIAPNVSKINKTKEVIYYRKKLKNYIFYLLLILYVLLAKYL